ncbi:MAG: glycosyltransferase family 2 protein [Opitutae bacterium]|jgi:glycosyltransferase involved in cell wall biosynthesis|nr:glycosyltransferase family 2 protein [Opitutae bacterium]MBT5908692.1 glycosyltransferase family 2 protein [Opitutae bacterium]
MKDPLPLSVSIIAKNEAENLKRCLESLQGIAKEIILVHNDCTDKTVETGKSFGAKCVENAWQGYIEQKNFALSKCSEDWILSLDADEALSEKLKDSIQAFLRQEKTSENYDGALFCRCSFFLGRWIRHGDWYPDKKVRLVRKGKARWVGTNPHDKMKINGKGACKLLKGDLLHYSYGSLREIPSKAIKYSDLYLENQCPPAKPPSLVISGVARPLWRFFRAYVLRFGILDGAAGFIIAFSTAYETMIRHGRQWERFHVAKRTKEDFEK